MPSTVPFKNVSLFKTIQRFSTNYGYSLFNHFRAQLISKITHFLTAIIIYQQPYTIPHFRHLVYLSLGFVGIWYKPRLRCRGQLKCDGTRAETSFCLWAKPTSPFKSAGASVQSTTGSRSVRISGSNAGYTMIRSNVKGTGYPLHSPVSPSLPLPCVTVCHHISTGLYQMRPRFDAQFRWHLQGARDEMRQWTDVFGVGVWVGPMWLSKQASRKQTKQEQWLGEPPHIPTSALAPGSLTVLSSVRWKELPDIFNCNWVETRWQ